MATSVWLCACNWFGAVTLDGQDISTRTAAVRVIGEQPVEVELFAIDAHGRIGILNEARTDLMREFRSGDIAIQLKPRRHPSPCTPCWRNPGPPVGEAFLSGAIGDQEQLV